jgi:hypothetical protein
MLLLSAPMLVQRAPRGPRAAFDKSSREVCTLEGVLECRNGLSLSPSLPPSLPLSLPPSLSPLLPPFLPPFLPVKGAAHVRERIVLLGLTH